MSRTRASDHAVLRYLERVWGVDIEGLRRRIERTADVAAHHEAEAIVTGGVRYILRAGVVVTIEPAQPAPRHTRWRRRGRNGK